MKPRMSSNLSQFQPCTAELVALERLKNHYRLTREKSCEHSSAFIFDWIFFILIGNKDMHKSLDGFQ